MRPSSIASSDGGTHQDERAIATTGGSTPASSCSATSQRSALLYDLWLRLPFGAAAP